MARPPATEPTDDLHALLLEMSDEAVILHAGDRIELANQAAALLLGAPTPESLLGTPASALLAAPTAKGPAQVSSIRS